MREQSGAKPIASTIGAVFGGLWGFIAAMALPSAWTPFAIAGVALATAVVIAALWTARAPTERRERLFSRKAYCIAVILEVAAIYGASLILAHAGLKSYFIPVVGVIVGLHFIGLWIASGSKRFIPIAIGMCLVSIAASLLPAATGQLHARDFAAGAGNALVLWFITWRSRFD